MLNQILSDLDAATYQPRLLLGDGDGPTY